MGDAAEGDGRDLPDDPGNADFRTVNQPLADNIKNARLAARMTEAEAAEATGLALDLYINIERNELDPRYSQFCEIADGFSLTPAQLVAGELPAARGT